MNLKDKIRGMFLGIAIGDALGSPFESKKYEEVKNIKIIDDYVDGPRGKGTTTDDTQLTLAVANAIIEARGFDMNAIARHHVAAYNVTTGGWGGTSREAVKRIAEGKEWHEAADVDAPNRGFGNGVVMKLAPIIAHYAINPPFLYLPLSNITKMTHRTNVALRATFAHGVALYYCLNNTIESFKFKDWLSAIIESADKAETIYYKTIKNEENINKRFESLYTIYKDVNLLFDTQYLVDMFGGGSCYVYDSLPFSYAFFLRGPFNIDSLYEAAYAGGDADTNASIVGGLMGALSGESIFPKILVDGLKDKEEVLRAADAVAELTLQR